jgi:RNA-binding protein
MTFKHELAEKAKQLEPILRIGKSGLTENVIEEIKIQLKENKLIKIKLLRAFIEGKDKKEVGKEIASKTDSELINQVGFVVVLYKR